MGLLPCFLLAEVVSPGRVDLFSKQFVHVVWCVYQFVCVCCVVCVCGVSVIVCLPVYVTVCACLCGRFVRLTAYAHVHAPPLASCEQWISIV